MCVLLLLCHGDFFIIWESHLIVYTFFVFYVPCRGSLYISKCECKSWNHNGTFHFVRILNLLFSKNEAEKIYWYVDGFRVSIFLFILKWFGGGGGVKKAVICTSDFKMFRISFTWQFPVDYSAIGLYMNMLFVVNITCISFTKLSTNIVDEFFSVFYFKVHFTSILHFHSM